MARVPSRDLFPTDDPLIPGDLIGRAADVDDLVRNLSNGLHRIVTGARRTGKTSVCGDALARLRAGGAYTVEVDLWGVSTLAGFAHLVTRGAVANRPRVRRVLDTMKSTGTTALRGASLTMSTKLQAEFGEEVEIAFRPFTTARDPLDSVIKAFELLQRIAVTDNRRLVLYIDEFQEIADKNRRFGDPTALEKRMRTALQGADRVACLFAGSQAHLMKDLFSTDNRALFKFGGFQTLEPIDVHEWREGLIERFARDSCSVDEPALDWIIERGEGHPRTTMLIAQQTHALSTSSETHAIDTSLAFGGFANALGAERIRHQDDVEQVRQMGRSHLTVLQRVANGTPMYRGLPAKSAARAVSQLSQAGFIQQDRPRSRWEIVDPLFRRFLVRMGD